MANCGSKFLAEITVLQQVLLQDELDHPVDNVVHGSRRWK